MKLKLRYTLNLLMAIAIGSAVLSGCTEEETGGAPSVSYIRVTNPESADSLVVAAGQGQMVVIKGDNLGNVRELWFNDREATLNPSFITNSSVITRVPSRIPSNINNLMTLVFSNGDSLQYDFTVDIGEPYVERFKSEYVNEGEIAVLYGDYFYEPLMVTFEGGFEAEIVSVEDTELQVRVPAGAQVGPVTITSNFGSSTSDVIFKDDRNIIASFDGSFNGMWRGTDFVVSTDGDIPNISGDFIRINRGAQGPYPYMEIYGGPQESDTNLETRNIPVDALDNPSNYVLKFEINTQETFEGAVMRLYLGNADGGAFGAARNDFFYPWESNVDTGGEWQTISIPWKDVYESNDNFSYNSGGYGMYIYFHGGSPAIYNIGMDNFRVVPN
ncbi:glycan-binding surface protein [Reichenbachiella ulvae]|uniref:Glycan-binding surface protein n=1 Tax=Reichenbachiella ulvae TaxID=2980104 RepID=A0ABT3CTI6_9BACT|nr:glycan-binding surface protein [Reichenbachiella ulvae]MCV9387011.1 glycan-binding surface protein [Reichenbachiella ulvae]